MYLDFIRPGVLSLMAMVAADTAQAQSFVFGAGDTDTLTTRLTDGEYGSATSVIIMQSGETVYEAYFREADAETLHDTRSVTKTITGYAVATAIDDGLLTLSSAASGFFPDYEPEIAADPRKAQITVEDLLTMSSVMECNDWTEFSAGNEERMYLTEDWSRFFWSLPIRGYPSWATPPEEATYGRAFSYRTAGVQLLGELVSLAGEQPLTERIEQRIFEPLGIDNWEWPRNGLGDAHMGGGLRLTSRALASLAELQRANGVWEGRRILPESWTIAAIQPRAEIPQTPGFEYGYLWWLLPYEVAGQRYFAAAMNGNGGNRVIVMPEFDLVVVFTNTDYNTREMHQNAQAFFETEIVARLSD